MSQPVNDTPAQPVYREIEQPTVKVQRHEQYPIDLEIEGTRYGFTTAEAILLIDDLVAAVEEAQRG